MLIGYDAKRIFNNYAGLGNYSRAVVDYMAEFYPSYNFHFFTPRITLSEFESQYSNQKNINLHTAGASNPKYWRTYSITKELVVKDIDIYHGLTHELPRNIKKASCATVVTIHDLIFKRYPRYFPITDRTFYNLKWKHALNTADKIVAISLHTKSDIIEYYNIPEEKIEVIYNTCHPRFYNPEPLQKKTISNLPDAYLLSVGSIEPRKNYDSLIRAVSLIPKDNRKPLVIVGRGRKRYVEQIKKLILLLDLDKDVQLRSDITNNQIVELYQRADMLVYPSHYEGHGLPITESLLCGTPVIASETSSMKEAGGPDCLYFAPNNVASLKAKIERLSDDSQLADSIAKKGKDYAQDKFDISKTAQQMNNLYCNL